MSYDEQIISKDKYPSIFSPQMATIVFIILQIFLVTRAVLKIGEYLISVIPQFHLGWIRLRDVFRPIARERKYLMDYIKGETLIDLRDSLKRSFPNLKLISIQNVSLVEFSLKRFDHGSCRPSGSLELDYRENFPQSAPC